MRVVLTKNGEQITFTDDPSRPLVCVREAWQRMKLIGKAFCREDHRFEVRCEVLSTGYICWFAEMKCPKGGFVWRVPNSWDTWEGIEALFIEWLYENQISNTFPPGFHGALEESTMRRLPGVPGVPGLNEDP